MDSVLLNIWRENGAYLRFGDGKNIFLLGVSLALLTAYVDFVVGTQSSGFALLGSLSSLKLEFNQSVVMGLFVAAAFFSALSAIPSLSKKTYRVNFLIFLGRIIYIVKGAARASGTTFFLDIAAYKDSNAYGSEFLKSYGNETSLTAYQTDLIEQIWIVSKIGSAKYVTSWISIVCLVVGILIAIK